MKFLPSVNERNSIVELQIRNLYKNLRNLFCKKYLKIIIPVLAPDLEIRIFDSLVFDQNFYFSFQFRPKVKFLKKKDLHFNMKISTKIKILVRKIRTKSFHFLENRT